MAAPERGGVSPAGGCWSRDRCGRWVLKCSTILAQHDLEVARSGDQEVVEAFPAQGADEALGDGVGQRRRLHLIESMRPIGIGGCG